MIAIGTRVRWNAGSPFGGVHWTEGTAEDVHLYGEDGWRSCDTATVVVDGTEFRVWIPMDRLEVVR